MAKYNRPYIYLFFALCALIAFSFFWKYKYKEGLINSNIEIVVSRYNEDLEWLNNKPFSEFPVICYNKGKNDDYNVINLKKTIKLKNVGREAHTYLYHIIKNYDNLAQVTIFLPGSGNSSVYNKHVRASMLVDEVSKYKNTVVIGVKHNNVRNDLYNFKMETYVSTTPINVKINSETNLQLSKIRPYGKWYDTNFKYVKNQYICYSSIISVSKKHILQHSKQYYINLISELSTSSNPEVGHYFERSWVAIFSPLTDAKYIDVSKLF